MRERVGEREAHANGPRAHLAAHARLLGCVLRAHRRAQHRLLGDVVHQLGADLLAHGLRRRAATAQDGIQVRSVGQSPGGESAGPERGRRRGRRRRRCQRVPHPQRRHPLQAQLHHDQPNDVPGNYRSPTAGSITTKW